MPWPNGRACTIRRISRTGGPTCSASSPRRDADQIIGGGLTAPSESIVGGGLAASSKPPQRDCAGKAGRRSNRYSDKQLGDVGARGRPEDEGFDDDGNDAGHPKRPAPRD